MTQPQHCDHECVCPIYGTHCAYGYPCTHNTGLMGTTTTAECTHDTRPHTQPERNKPCEEQGCTDIENCDEICDHSRIYSPAWVKEHDTAIRNATLGEAIKAWEKWFDYGYERPIQKKSVSNMLRSLRSTSPPTTKESAPKCTMNHHNDDGTLIEYLGEGKPCGTCSIRQSCFETFYAYRRKSTTKESGE